MRLGLRSLRVETHHDHDLEAVRGRKVDHGQGRPSRDPVDRDRNDFLDLNDQANHHGVEIETEGKPKGTRQGAQTQRVRRQPFLQDCV